MVRAILGQLVSIKVACTLVTRFAEKFGENIETNIDGLNYIFPIPKRIINEYDIINKLGEMGITRIKSNAICELAKLFVEEKIDFEHCLNPEAEIKRLMSIKGIGEWTAKYVAMRTMNYTDAFLNTDYGIIKALEPYKPKEILEMSEEWKPWRSYATINLWNTL